MSVASWFCTCFCVVLCVSFCTSHFVMVPLNLKYLHCLQHSFFEHIINLYLHICQYTSDFKSKFDYRYECLGINCIQSCCFISMQMEVMFGFLKCIHRFKLCFTSDAMSETKEDFPNGSIDI